MRWALSSFIFVLLLFGGTIDHAHAESYSALRAEYQKLSHSAQMQRQRTNWERLLRRFDRYVGQNPLAPELDKVLFLQARTWDGLSKASGRTDDAREAVTRYVALAAQFPDSRLSDDALFHAGQASEYRLGDRTMARLYYLRLVTRFPDGDMVDEAHKRLAILPKPRADKAPPMALQQDSRTVGAAPELEKIRFWSGPEYTRIVLELTAPVVAKPYYLKGEQPRLYFDLLYTLPSASVTGETAVRNGLVKQVRTSLFDEQRTRVVIDLNRVAEYKLTTLEDPHRLVVDILGAPQKYRCLRLGPPLQSKQLKTTQLQTYWTVLPIGHRAFMCRRIMVQKGYV